MSHSMINRLPAADQAVVPLEKLTAYVLNPNHPVNRTQHGGKARVFAAVGYSPDQAYQLTHDILSHLPCAEAHPIPGVWGNQWRVRIPHVRTPTGHVVTLETRWILRDEVPYLVTAFVAPD